MRVLYLTNLTVPYRMKFFNELGKKCDLTVIVERNSATNRDDVWLSSVRAENFQLIQLNGIKIGEESSFCYKIYKYLKEDYDMIVIGGYSTLTAMFAIMYLKLYHKSFVLNADGGLINHNENRLVKFIKTFFISSASNWLTTSSEAVEYLCHYGAIKKNIYIYPFSSIEESEITFISKNEKKVYKKELSVDENKLMILNVGQIIHRKGIDILIQSFFNLNETKFDLYIVGGKPTEELSLIINDKNLNNVHFIEFADKNLLSKYYKAADLFVIPSRFDVWGLVVNEALAYSLPIISSDKVGAATTILDKKYIFESENVDDLSRLLKKILSNRTELELASKENYEKAKQYTIEKMVIEHLNIFNEIERKTSK